MNFVSINTDVSEIRWLRGQAVPMRHYGDIWLDMENRVWSEQRVRAIALWCSQRGVMFVLDIECLPTVGVPDDVADANANLLGDIARTARSVNAAAKLACYAVPPFYGQVGTLDDMRKALARIRVPSTYVSHFMPSAYLASTDAADGLAAWSKRMMWRISMSMSLARENRMGQQVVPLLMPYYANVSDHARPVPLDLLERAASFLVGITGNVGWWPCEETSLKYGGDPKLPWREVANAIAQRGGRF